MIALVVTIIVLLILAGISISMLMGQNGILNRTQEAKERTELAQKEELDKITEMEAMVQTAGTKVTNPSSYGENSNAQATADGAGKYFALPDGATYVEGTVDTGVVVNIKKSEFVWVPVDDVVLDESREDELPKSSEVGTASGKTYTPMAVKVGNDYKGLLYDFKENNGYLIYGGNLNYQGGSTDYREPDVVSYDIDDFKSEGITKELLISEYNAMIESVKKYKGFYVARYEAGLDKTTNEIVFKNESVKENNVTTADASNIQTNSWYGLYKKIQTFTKTGNIGEKVVSRMIWGSQYDAMMNWMLKEGNNVGIENKDIYNKSTITGSNNTDIINNIYDLHGCHLEWTVEAIVDIDRVERGGRANDYHYPAFRSGGSPNYRGDVYSSRATLYIK